MDLLTYTYQNAKEVSEEINVAYNGSEEVIVNLAEKVASYGLTDVEYILKDSEGILAETATEGVYEVFGNTVDGAVVEVLSGDFKFVFIINSNSNLDTDVFEVNDESVYVLCYVDESYEGKNFFAVAYDENGEIVGTTRDDVYEYGEIDLWIETSAKAAYTRLFFWEDLTNIRPYSAPLVLR